MLVGTGGVISVHPRIRGERAIARPTVMTVRFIPAYAGNASLRQPFSIRVPVHPRIRGERYRVDGQQIIKAGSSPHTRGTLDPLHDHHYGGRFIPAYAGNALPISY